MGTIHECMHSTVIWLDLHEAMGCICGRKSKKKCQCPHQHTVCASHNRGMED